MELKIVPMRKARFPGEIAELIDVSESPDEATNYAVWDNTNLKLLTLSKSKASAKAALNFFSTGGRETALRPINGRVEEILCDETQVLILPTNTVIECSSNEQASALAHHLRYEHDFY